MNLSKLLFTTFISCLFIHSSSAQLMQINFSKDQTYFQDKTLRTPHKKKIRYGRVLDLIEYKRKTDGYFILHIKISGKDKEGYLLMNEKSIRPQGDFLRMVERVDFERAKEANSLELYTDYLENHNKYRSKYKEVFKLKRELEFNSAIESRDLKEINNFLIAYKYKIEFEKRKELMKLGCELEFERLTKLNVYSIDEAQYFLQNCSQLYANPEEREAVCAQAANSLKSKKEFHKGTFNRFLFGCKNTKSYTQIAGFADSLQQATLASQRAKTDKADFETAQGSFSDNSFMTYLSKHPDGAYVEKAMSSIEAYTVTQLQETTLIKVSEITSIISNQIATRGDEEYVLGILMDSKRTVSAIAKQSLLMVDGHLYFKEGQLINFNYTRFPLPDEQGTLILGKGKASIGGVWLLPGTLLFRKNIEKE